MTDGLCQCGCGQPAPVAKRTVRSRGRIKDQPMKFIRGHNSVGMTRSKPYKKERYRIEDRGYATPCWLWLLKMTSAGYGYTRVHGKGQSAHRFYYEQAKGPIPAGLQIDHLCGVRACVNPDHMEVVTPMENTRRNRGTKLSLERARDIHSIATTTGLSSYRIAEMFGVSRQTVDLIRKNGADGPRRPR